MVPDELSWLRARVAELELALHTTTTLANASKSVEHRRLAGVHEESTIFDLPIDFDKRFLMAMIAMLVVVTIGFEKGTQLLEDIVAGSGSKIQRELLGKVFSELTVLGFVSFCAMMLLQAQILPLTHAQQIYFEFAHVLMFTTALVYAKEIYRVAYSLQWVQRRFVKFDEVPNQDVLDAHVRRYGTHLKDAPKSKETAGPQRQKTLQRFARAAQHSWSENEGVAAFKALKFHFLGFHRLLGTRFSLARYIEKCTETYVGELVDIDPASWAYLLALLVVTIGLDCIGALSVASAEVSTVMTVLWGFLLLLCEAVVFRSAKSMNAGLLERNHHTVGRFGSRSTRNPRRRSLTVFQEPMEHQVIVETELRVLALASEDKRQRAVINAEMGRARELSQDEVQRSEQHTQADLRRVQIGFMTLLLLQSMLQSLILLMQVRHCVKIFDGLLGAVVLLLMWLPTELMSQVVTPRVVAEIALANAMGIRNKRILEEMIEEATTGGDYMVAAQVLEVAMMTKLNPKDLENEVMVRDKVNDLIKLGELKWRHRVVEEGQNPRDEAIRVLDEAESYISSHVKHKCGDEGDELAHAKYKSEHWAEELSECYQGLALSRLIFNGANRTDDDDIRSLLERALHLREVLQHRAKMADTHNSLGSLWQKQQKYDAAEAAYKKALELRRALEPQIEKEALEKQQALAQSYTSLGNLYKDTQAYPKALEYLKLAKEHYIKGFHKRHPKVAWAVEAMADVHTKMHSYRLAQIAIEEAIAIRTALQEKGDGKALFSKELEHALAVSVQIEESRKVIRRRLSNLEKSVMHKRHSRRSPRVSQGEASTRKSSVSLHEATMGSILDQLAREREQSEKKTNKMFSAKTLFGGNGSKASLL